MLSRVMITLKKSDTGFTHNISSLFQGALMEVVPETYGNLLHEDGIKPYSQAIFSEKEHLIWTVNTLDEDSSRYLLEPLLSKEFDHIYLKQKQLKLEILKKEKLQLKYETLLMNTFFSKCGRYVTVKFKTPTAFKSEGRYQFYPTVWHIFRSLTSKFDRYSMESEIGFKENLDDIDKYVNVVRYSLHSTYFHMEGIRIPAFLGTVTLKIDGPQQMVNLIHLLLRFGEFSGVGIKCAMGMGAIELLEKKEQKKDG